MSDVFNKISGETTRMLGCVLPDNSLVFPADEYCPIGVHLDENKNAVVVDFAKGCNTGDARGATVLFRRRSLVVFIHMLQAALECLEPGEIDEDEDEDEEL